MLYVSVTGAPIHNCSLLATTLSCSALGICASFTRACTDPAGISLLAVNLFC
ncbi:hypothetical protein PF005_g18740 [Phytophthora fragariae]|uniref:Uncharacterized protein n=1 Tax=Phytophthora fragariae TaxID=53985 RepID=A0A6A3RDF2_9STRA|nr:hypothetical protein PF003_g24296 [Phytophthora fragariae]KAE8930258.1 hypothetical protein PF009_g19643 [Phytophthora fragariae]KAE8986052.1 hypothetical protein PF011_g20147 [Phytophthora fragariae]KAE9092041.1 hypothetical protein PF007_g18667 [Phytophthora fragariae]KAE9111300.1 hypothetical protein PF006_g20247 [Phytophthora fragariae]